MQLCYVDTRLFFCRTCIKFRTVPIPASFSNCPYSSEATLNVSSYLHLDDTSLLMSMKASRKFWSQETAGVSEQQIWTCPRGMREKLSRHAFADFSSHHCHYLAATEHDMLTLCCTSLIYKVKKTQFCLPQKLQPQVQGI